MAGLEGFPGPDLDARQERRRAGSEAGDEEQESDKEKMDTKQSNMSKLSG